MISRDYTKEMKLNVGERPVPWPIAVTILTLVMATGALLVRQMHVHGAGDQTADKAPVKLSSR